jgi:dTDP-4-amino-4,6-dideoxygalactose transaminase
MSQALAIEGAIPVRTDPFPEWPHFSAEEIERASAVLRSGKVNYWTGTEGRQFEEEFAAAVGVKHAVAVANGTVALELALYALGIGPGHEVIVTPRSFIASASSVVLRGATPVFVDVDRDTQNISTAAVRAAITPRTKAIMAVHLAGWPCDMDNLLPLANEFGLFVIEDCAQSHGAKYRKKAVGSLGHVAAFSFCQDKIMTTAGEGGMITTASPEIWERCWSYKDHGKSFDAVYKRAHPPGFRWLHESFGTNWRLTEIQSAIGRIQLQRLSADVSARRKNARRLADILGEFRCIRLTRPAEWVFHSYYKYYAFVNREALRRDWSRDKIVAAIAAEGVPCLQGSCSEIYLENAFPDEMRPAGRLPVAEELGDTSLMFVVHPTITDADMNDYVRAIEKVLTVASA